MGVKQSVNGDQLRRVLAEFHATHDAIRNIETKVSRTCEHVDNVHTQQKVFWSQYDRANEVGQDLLGLSAHTSSALVDQFTTGLECTASGLKHTDMTRLEQVERLPQEIVKSFGPMACPTGLLVLIVTVSNVVFGFMLAGDKNLKSEYTSLGTAEPGEDAIDVVQLFAVFHVSLIGVLVLYYFSEEVSRLCSSRPQRQPQPEANEEGRPSNSSSSASSSADSSEDENQPTSSVVSPSSQSIWSDSSLSRVLRRPTRRIPTDQSAQSTRSQQMQILAVARLEKAAEELRKKSRDMISRTPGGSCVEDEGG